MATTKFYLDARAVAQGKPAPLKLAITHKGETALLPLNIRILPSQWDKVRCKVVNHPNKLFLNTYLNRRKQEVDTGILRLLEEAGSGHLRAKAIKEAVRRDGDEDGKADGEGLFADRFKLFAEGKKESTKGVYMHTYSRMSAFDKKLQSRRFEDITKEWLVAFDTYLARTSPSRNARNIHMRNIRAVFNEAIDNELTTAYPFRRFKIRPVATAKRSLSVDELRKLFDAPVESHAKKYLDMFKLSFFLIGINLADVCRLKEVTPGGRVEYHRAKTGRLYSIKVEPEALQLMSCHRGKGQLLDILDTYERHQDYLKHLNRALQGIGEVSVGKRGKKTRIPFFPTITTYWARHTWATLAASLDIPKETIAAALGHGGNTVTDIYIDFDRKKVDEANRKVMDWVLYGKR